MKAPIFKYRSRELTPEDIAFIQDTVNRHYALGRSHISRVLCQVWNWTQPNGKLKEYAARDLLLRLEEKEFVKLPPRLSQNNNLKRRSFDQIPIFIAKQLGGSVGNYSLPVIQPAVSAPDKYLWNYLVHHHHYLGCPRLVGEYIRHLAYIDDQVVACLAWASAAWKIKAREEFIGWNEATKRKNLHLVVNNTRFLILPWVKVKYLASRILSLSLKRLIPDWQKAYGHPVYLAETFVDTSRFKGTCYRAANWHYAGQTSGSAKRGNAYSYHGQPKAIYLYPLHRHFRRYLNDEEG